MWRAKGQVNTISFHYHTDQYNTKLQTQSLSQMYDWDQTLD